MEIIKQRNQSESDFIRKRLIEYNMEKLPDELKTPYENISFMIKDKKEKLLAVLRGKCFGITYILIFYGLMKISGKMGMGAN